MLWMLYVLLKKNTLEHEQNQHKANQLSLCFMRWNKVELVSLLE